MATILNLERVCDSLPQPSLEKLLERVHSQVWNPATLSLASNAVLQGTFLCVPALSL